MIWETRKERRLWLTVLLIFHFHPWSWSLYCPTAVTINTRHQRWSIVAIVCNSTNTPEAEYHTISLAPLFPNAGRFYDRAIDEMRQGCSINLLARYLAKRKAQLLRWKMTDGKYFLLRIIVTTKAHTQGALLTIGAIINTRHPCFVFLLHFLDMKPYFMYFMTLTPNNMKHSLILPNN